MSGNLTVSSLSVADVMLRSALASGVEDMTNMKVNNLVFIAHGWHLGSFNTPLIQPEQAEVWSYGPVFFKLYCAIRFRLEEERRARNHALTEVDFFMRDKMEMDKRSLDLVNHVSSVYQYYPANKLVEFTHQRSSPWSRSYDSGMDTIPNKFIQEYYEERLNAALAEN